MRFDRHYLVRKHHNSRSIGKLLVVSSLAITCWFGYREIQSYYTEPEAVVVLGGDEAREKFAADLAREHPYLDIWVSSGSPQNYVERIFAFRGIEGDRLHLNYRADDTVTNFTTLVDELKASGIESVYLVTSDSHMTRARIIGEIVFGSRGIIIKPMAVPSQFPSESLAKSARDSARAILWLFTGCTGSTWKK